MSDLQKEREIPVFTVWKNNSILKNIFLINTPPNFDDQNSSKTHQDHGLFEETLLVGRHPDCDIRLEHPSISRNHLRIHSLPCSKLLFITDLSSVHGTWVSGKRIEPNIRTRIKEGDDLNIGGSSRVYKLQWIPLSQAYDVSQPFVPPLDFQDPQEDEDEPIKDENLPGPDNDEVYAFDNISDHTLKGLEHLDICDNDVMVAEKEVPQTLPLQPQKSLLVEDEGSESSEVEYEGLESLCWQDISPELKLKGILQVTPTQNEDCESEGTSVDSVLEGLVPLFMGENWKWIGVEEKYLPCPTEEDHLESSRREYAGLLDSALEGLDSLFLDEGSELFAHKLVPSAPPLPEDADFPTAENLVGIAPEVGSEHASDLENEKQSLLQGEGVEDGAWNYWFGSPQTLSSPATVGGLLVPDPHHLVTDNEIQTNESEPRRFFEEESLDSTITKPYSSAIENQESKLWSFWSGKMGVESVCSAVSDAEFFSESETKSLRNSYQSSPLSSLKKQTDSPMITSVEKSARSIWSSRGNLESICSSLSDIDFSESDNKSCVDDYQSPNPLSSAKDGSKSILMTSEQTMADSIWSRRGKMASAPQVLTSRTEEKKEKKDQENAKHECLSRPLFHGKYDQEVEEEEEELEEVFTPDKENYTPYTHKSMRKLAMLKEIKRSNSGKRLLSKMTSSPSNHCENAMSPFSDKENYSPKTLPVRKSSRLASPRQVQSVRLKDRKGERMPFQSLLVDSPEKILSEGYIPDSDDTSRSSVTSATSEDVKCKENCCGKRLPKWNMVVDTTTLLNRQSRKALQLLEGLKGTQLIIPRIVLSELSSLKQQLSFFRRNTEVLSALDWIQDCMVKTPWWIHVQSSMDEGRPVAPTPPASPISDLSCGTTGSYAFFGLESRRELLSPTVQDDVLDYALNFRKFKNDGQLVLLSEDVTLKIKSMSEGMICETAEEFRESLVNPFSERFRWTDSSPRGQTWTCTDDIVLKEKFYPSSMRMTPKAMENVKGLKLILLHNSQYYERMTAIR